ncbi:hypothetical protein B0T24DRAFT_630197, partial [Lasiosphaeria ovina]
MPSLRVPGCVALLHFAHPEHPQEFARDSCDAGRATEYQHSFFTVSAGRGSSHVSLPTPWIRPRPIPGQTFLSYVRSPALAPGQDIEDIALDARTGPHGLDAGASTLGLGAKPDRIQAAACTLFASLQSRRGARPGQARPFERAYVTRTLQTAVAL